MNILAKGCFSRALRDESGVAAIFAAVLFPALLLATGVAVDLGVVHLARHRLQHEANVAALAGAQVLNPTTGSSQAAIKVNESITNNSTFALPKNRLATVALVCSNTVKTIASVSTTMTNCTGSDSANAVKVTETADIPLFFGGFMGRSKQNVSVTATAGANIGGVPPKLNVMIVLDTSASMNSIDSNCGKSRVACALDGVENLLSQLSPSIHKVGISVFPGVLNSSSISAEYCATSGKPSIVAYNANPIYTLFTPGGAGTTNYRTGSPLKAGLNTASPLAKAVGYAGSNCSGIQAIGGVGTYFADAITNAQTVLQASHQTDDQDVIVLLSDGDAGASSSNMASNKKNRQCQQAVDAAKAATAAGTWVYSLAYDAQLTGCSTDNGLSPCNTMKQIASDPSKFFSSASSGSSKCVSTSSTSTASISGAFSDIAGRMIKPRLIPN